MKKSQLHLDGIDLIVSVKKTPRSIRIVLTILLVIFFIIPIGAIISTCACGIGFNFGHVIISIISWLSAYFLLRILLWNAYGRELYSFANGNVSYVADYKLFRDPKREIEGDIVVDILKIGKPDQDYGTLVFKSGDNTIISVIEVPYSELSLLVVELKKLLYNYIIL